MKEINFNILILAITVLGLTGCSATGKKFHAFEEAENNKSIVYFYRVGQFLGSAKTIDVMEVKASSMARLKASRIAELNEENNATTEDENLFDDDQEVNAFDENAIGFDDVDQVGKLRRKSYFKKSFEPGTHYFVATGLLNDPYEFQLEPNDYICIRADVEYSNTPLLKINKQLCYEQIKHTREITAEDKANVLY